MPLGMRYWMGLCVIICDKYRVPKGTPFVASNLPAVETAGYPYLMPMASILQNLWNLKTHKLIKLINSKT